MSAREPPSKSVRPTVPANRVSPEMSTGRPSGWFPNGGMLNRQMEPGVCPGVSMTFHFMEPISTTSPWETARSTLQGTPRIAKSLSEGSSIRGASLAEAITGAPVASRNSAAAPVWSKWECVSTMASSASPPSAAMILSAEQLGSTTNVPSPSDTI